MQIQVGDSTVDKALGTWGSLKRNSIASGAAVLTESECGQNEPDRTQQHQGASLGLSTHSQVRLSDRMSGRPVELCFLNFKSEQVKRQPIKSRSERRLQRSRDLSNLPKGKWRSGGTRSHSQIQRRCDRAFEEPLCVRPSAEGAGAEGSSDPRLEGWTVNATSLMIGRVLINNISYREVKLRASPRPELGLAGAGLDNQYFKSVSHQLFSFHDQHLTRSRMLLLMFLTRQSAPVSLSPWPLPPHAHLKTQGPFGRLWVSQIKRSHLHES